LDHPIRIKITEPEKNWLQTKLFVLRKCYKIVKITIFGIYQSPSAAYMGILFVCYQVAIFWLPRKNTLAKDIFIALSVSGKGSLSNILLKSNLFEL
jgi:hypothetical protein